MLKLKLPKFSGSTELTWPKNLPLTLLTIGSTPNGNHKLTPHEIITGRLMFLVVKPHIDTSLIYPEVIQYWKYLMHFTKLYFQQVEEELLNPDSINLPPCNLKFGLHWRDQKLKKKNTPTTNTEAKLQGWMGPWLPHLSNKEGMTWFLGLHSHH